MDVIDPTTGDQQFYSILQDYQDENGTMIYGGNGFLRMINFDVENNLVYFNTYSPLTGETETPWAAGTYSQIDGLYQKNRDEFAVEVDLGGNQERTFTTSALSISTDTAEKIGTVTTAGNETVKYHVSGLKPGQGYTWYAETTDSAGNVTVTAQRGFRTPDQAEEPEVTGLEIAHAPNLTDYVEGESFNPEGMVVNAVYSDGSRKEVTDYTVEPDGPLTVEDTAVIIKWNGMTAQVVISVRSGSSETPVITGIEITTAPERTEYKEGEIFNPKGMVVSAVYSDGRRQTVTDYTYEPSGALTAEHTEITVSWEGMTAQLPISVSDASGDNQPGGVENEPDQPSGGNDQTAAPESSVATGDETQLAGRLSALCISAIIATLLIRRRRTR